MDNIEGLAGPTWAEENADVVAFLEGYKGNFEFLISLRKQLEALGKLTPAQLAGARKCMSRERKTKITRPKIRIGQLIRVPRHFAKKFGNACGLGRPHFVLRVVEAIHETDKAYLLRVQLSGTKTSVCSICGLALTDPRSVAIGIGPICAGNIGAPWGETTLSHLKEELKTTGVAEGWLPKTSVKFIEERD